MSETEDDRLARLERQLVELNSQNRRILDHFSTKLLPKLDGFETEQRWLKVEVHAMRSDLARSASKAQEHEGRISLTEGLPTNGFHGELILLVDDEPGIVGPIARFLQSCGARVVLADSIRGARLALQAERPTAAIVDVGLGDGDGIELAAELEVMGVGVLVISGWPDRITGWPEGKRLHKPCGFDAIHAKLLELLPRVADTDPAPPFDREAPTMPGSRLARASDLAPAPPITPDPDTHDETPEAKRGGE